MINLSAVGRIFYGISIAVIGMLTVYRHDFPYMLIPPKHQWIPGLTLVAYIFGAFFIVAGACIVFKKTLRFISLLLGTLLLLIFCFYFVPFQFISSPDYMHFGDWENAAKELALSSGAFVIAGCASIEKENTISDFLSRLIPLGTILFAVTIISFSIDHFLFAVQAADYVPSWIPFHVFWMYFTGTALLCSGVAILLNIKRGLAAFLLGTMIFIWFAILHVPRIIVSPTLYIPSEIASACLALAYSGIAFVISSVSRLKGIDAI